MTNSGEVVARADQAISPDGRTFVAILYNRTRDQTPRFRFRRAASVRLIDPGTDAVTEHVVAAGEAPPLSMPWGRVVVGTAVP